MRNTSPHDANGGVFHDRVKKPTHLPSREPGPNDFFPRWADPESKSATQLIPGYSRRSQKRQLRRRKASPVPCDRYLEVNPLHLEPHRGGGRCKIRRRALYVATPNCKPTLP